MELKHETPTESVITKLTQGMANQASPWAVVALALVLMVAGGCAVNVDAVNERREEIRELCEGAVTTALRNWCESKGISTEPAEPTETETQ